jgi:hypothetical protein
MLQDLQLFYEQVTQTSSRAWIARARNKYVYTLVIMTGALLNLPVKTDVWPAMF